MLPSIFVLGCLATLIAAAPADQGVEIIPSIDMSDIVAAQADEQDSYRQAASPVSPASDMIPPHDPEAPDHALAPPPADHVAPVARAIAFTMPEESGDELVREKRQFGYGGYGGYGGYRRRGHRRNYGGYYGGGGYPGYYGGGGYPGGYYGGGYPGGFGGGLGGSSAQSNAQSQSISIGGGFGPFTGSISSSQASSSAGGFGFGR